MAKKPFREKVVALIHKEGVHISPFVEEAIDNLVERVEQSVGGDLETRVDAIVEVLEQLDRQLLARGEGGLQHEVDELIYDHCGTSKHWSEVNNAGYGQQVPALVAALGLAEAERLIAELVESAKTHLPVARSIESKRTHHDA